MTTNLTPELQKQIEQEASAYASSQSYKNPTPLDEDWDEKEANKVPFTAGAEIYALKWQEAERRAERHEKALFEIQFKATSAIFPHLPVETIGAQMCVEIEKIATMALTPKQTTDEQRPH